MTEHFPVLLGEAIPGVMNGRPVFPFKSWAQNNSFRYPDAAESFLSNCGSAAEAYFARVFCERGGVGYDGPAAFDERYRIELQRRASLYYIDAIVSDGRSSLAIEIDGMQFHHRTKEQVAADYLRERRIVLLGHTVIRFTAPEVFRDAKECWRQVYAILAKRGES